VKHWGKGLFGLTVTVVLLWWALRDVAFAEVWARIRQGDMLLLGAAVAVATFGFFIRALRWKILLTPVKPDTALRSRFAGVSIGFMANNVLPARVGEFARALAFSRLEPVSASAAFGSLVVERFLDGVVLLLFLVIPVLTPGFPSTGVLSQGFGAVALKAAVAAVAAVLLILVVMAVFPAWFIRTTERFAHLLPRALARPVVDALAAFLDSVAILRSPRLLSLAFAWTLAFWTWPSSRSTFWLSCWIRRINSALDCALALLAKANGAETSRPATISAFARFPVSMAKPSP